MSDIAHKINERVEERLAACGITLPEAKPALASYQPYRICGTQLFISGQGPVDEAGKAICGCLGAGLDVETGARAARLAGINILAQVNHALQGDWSRLKACLKLTGYVCASADFTAHPQIINGASDLLVEICGDMGQHSRAAIGVSSLPLGWAVEIDALFALTDEHE